MTTDEGDSRAQMEALMNCHSTENTSVEIELGSSSCQSEEDVCPLSGDPYHSSVPEIGESTFTWACSCTGTDDDVAESTGPCTFQDACEKNQTDTVVSMLAKEDHRTLMTSCNTMGFTGLALACAEGHSEVVNAICSNVGGDLLREALVPKGRHGMTPLHWAVEGGHAEVVEVLINHVSDDVFSKMMQQKICNKWTLFDIACSQNFVDVLQLLLSKVKDSKMYEDLHHSLYFACRNGNVESVKCLLNNVGVEEMDKILKKNVAGGSALHWACVNKDLELVKVLMERNKDRFDVMRHLLLNNNNFQLSVFEIASKERKILDEVLRVIGCQAVKQILSITDENGRTAMHWASENGDDHLFKKLLSRLEDVDKNRILLMQDNKKNTALHVACQHGHIDVVRSIITNIGSQKLHQLIKVGNREKMLPVEIAYRANHYNVIAEFLKDKDKLQNNIKAEFLKQLRSTTVIHQACTRAEVYTVQNILSCARDLYTNTGFVENLAYFLTKTDSDGRTILSIACNRKDREMTKYILKTIQSLKSSHSKLKVDILCHLDKNQKSVLFECSRVGNEQLVRLLLDTAARNDCVTRLLCSGAHSPLYAAFDNNYHHTVKLLADVAVASGCLGKLLIFTNNKGETMLHRACHDTFNLKCLEVILNAGKSDKDAMKKMFTVKDNNGKTFLFYTMQSWATTMETLIASTVELFGNNEEEIYKFLSEKDDSGHTAIHYAQEGKLSHHLAMLFAPFHKAVDTYKKPEDFKLLHVELDSSNYRESKRRSLLSEMVQTECLTLIGDKYTQAYLNCCWRSHGRYFFVSNIITFILLLASLSFFVVNHELEKSIINGTESADNFRVVCLYPQVSIVAQYLLIVTASLILVYEFMQMSAKGCDYWKACDNYADLIICLGSLIVSAASLPTGYQLWHHQVGISVLCVAWVHAAWMFTKIPSHGWEGMQSLSLMFIMLFRVMRRVCYFIPVFAVFIFTFSMAFSCLVPQQEPFKHIGYAIMKSLGMAIGELDLSSLFFPESDNERPPFYILTCFVFVIFIGIMSVSAMNLLTGMAVGDTNELRALSEVFAFGTTVDFTLETQAVLDFLRKRRKTKKST